MSPKDHINKAEIGKDALADIFEATVTAVGAVVTTITTAVRDIARTVGGLATEVFDIRESAGPPRHRGHRRRRGHRRQCRTLHLPPGQARTQGFPCGQNLG